MVGVSPPVSYVNMALTITPVGAVDAALVADLHATSWRYAYRGILTDAFLDADLVGERHRTWQAKLAEPNAGPGWIARIENLPVGFVYVRPREDLRWGTLVDNLHVLAMHHGRGVGRLLLNTVGRWCAEHVPDAPVHLWVYEANRPARAFYARMGGAEVEHVDKLASDGRMLPEFRVAWEDAHALIQATE